MWLECWALNALHQLLDAMDGTMARMFSLQSEFGAKLDEITDILFGGITVTSPAPAARASSRLGRAAQADP